MGICGYKGPQALTKLGGEQAGLSMCSLKEIKTTLTKPSVGGNPDKKIKKKGPITYIGFIFFFFYLGASEHGLSSPFFSGPRIHCQ